MRTGFMIMRRSKLFGMVVYKQPYNNDFDQPQIIVPGILYRYGYGENGEIIPLTMQKYDSDAVCRYGDLITRCKFNNEDLAVLVVKYDDSYYESSAFECRSYMALREVDIRLLLKKMQRRGKGLLDPPYVYSRYAKAILNAFK